MYHCHRRYGHARHQRRTGLPLVGVRVGVGFGGDVEHPGVAAPTIAETKAIRTSCDALAATSKDAIDKVNAYVAAFNQGRNTGPTEGPAIDALNNSASTVSGSLSAALSAQLGDALNAYVDAARAVANAIGAHASTAVFNRRVDRLNDTKTKALTMCVAAF